MQKTFFKYGLVLLWLAIIITPPLLFISRASVDALRTTDSIFPLFGLLGFMLIWSQIMLGAFLQPLTRLFPNAFRFHIWQGLLAILVIFFHPLFFFHSLSPSFPPNPIELLQLVDPSMLPYVLLGETAFYLLLASVAAALLRRWQPIVRFWRYIHMINYIVFFLALVHSWNIGSDLAASNILRTLWVFLALTVGVAFWYRRIKFPAQQIEPKVRATA